MVDLSQINDNIANGRGGISGGLITGDDGFFYNSTTTTIVRPSGDGDGTSGSGGGGSGVRGIFTKTGDGGSGILVMRYRRLEKENVSSVDLVRNTGIKVLGS